MINLSVLLVISLTTTPIRLLLIVIALNGLTLLISIEAFRVATILIHCSKHRHFALILISLFILGH